MLTNETHQGPICRNRHMFGFCAHGSCADVWQSYLNTLRRYVVDQGWVDEDRRVEITVKRPQQPPPTPSRKRRLFRRRRAR